MNAVVAFLFDSVCSTTLRSGDGKIISIFIPISRSSAVSGSKELMIAFTSDKTRGVSHRREKEEAVEFVSGHTHSLSERRQDGEFIIN